MNQYVKRLVDDRIEFLNKKEQELNEEIDFKKETLARLENKLKEVQNEKETLQK